MTFKPPFGPITILSLILVTFRVSRFPVSHLTHETVKLCLQNTLNMSKTTRVYFGVLQFPPLPPYKNFVLEIHTLACACCISDPFFSCLLQKLERAFHLSHHNYISCLNLSKQDLYLFILIDLQDRTSALGQHISM